MDLDVLEIGDSYVCRGYNGYICGWTQRVCRELKMEHFLLINNLCPEMHRFQMHRYII